MNRCLAAVRCAARSLPAGLLEGARSSWGWTGVANHLHDAGEDTPCIPGFQQPVGVTAMQQTALRCTIASYSGWRLISVMII